MDSDSGVSNITGIILAGGSSSRLGQDKALIDVGGHSLIERVAGRLRAIVPEILVVTDAPERYAFLELPTTGDLHPGIGTLGGLHAGLSAIRTEYALVAGCDMPFLNVDLIQYMISLLDEPNREPRVSAQPYDVIMPRIGEYHEPLHAIYARRCLPAVERTIRSGRRRLYDAYARLRIRYVEESAIARHDPHHLSFFNVNTPADLTRVKEIDSGLYHH